MNAYQDTVYLVRNSNEWIVPREVEGKIVLAPNQKSSSKNLLRSGKDHPMRENK